jgi:hypothetical protein
VQQPQAGTPTPPPLLLLLLGVVVELPVVVVVVVVVAALTVLRVVRVTALMVRGTALMQHQTT